MLLALYYARVSLEELFDTFYDYADIVRQLCHGLLEGWSLPKTIRYGNAAGAIVASRMMCADDMPTAAEVDAFLEERESR